MSITKIFMIEKDASQLDTIFIENAIITGLFQ